MKKINFYISCMLWISPNLSFISLLGIAAESWFCFRISSALRPIWVLYSPLFVQSSLFEHETGFCSWGLLCVCRPERSRISFTRRAAAEGVSAAGFSVRALGLGFPLLSASVSGSSVRVSPHREVLPCLSFCVSCSSFLSPSPGCQVILFLPSVFGSRVQAPSSVFQPDPLSFSLRSDPARSISIAQIGAAQVDFCSCLLFESAAPVCVRSARSSLLLIFSCPAKQVFHSFVVFAIGCPSCLLRSCHRF
jgi:hypothetical protein